MAVAFRQMERGINVSVGVRHLLVHRHLQLIKAGNDGHHLPDDLSLPDSLWGDHEPCSYAQGPVAH